MKATLIAAVLSLIVVSLPLQAANIQSTTKAPLSAIAKIDLNKADAQALSKSIKGIGPKRAEAIVKYREEHGNFKSIENLAEVKGIGNQFVKKHLSELQKVFAVD